MTVDPLDGFKRRGNTAYSAVLSVLVLWLINMELCRFIS